jgi:hypothetical protein
LQKFESVCAPSVADPDPVGSAPFCGRILGNKLTNK